MKKSRFLTFCFAFIPGAGHMYHNYMKRGISLMGLFAGAIALTSYFGWILFTLMIPIVWCAAFFDTFHVAYRDEATRQAKPDAWLWNELDGMEKLRIDPSKHKVLGVALVLLGAWLLLDTIPGMLDSFGITFLRPVYYFIRDNVPGLVVAVLLIWLGSRFIRGPKAVPMQDEYRPVDLPCAAAEEVAEDGE